MKIEKYYENPSALHINTEISPVGDDYFSSGKFAMPQNRYALCEFTFT